MNANHNGDQHVGLQVERIPVVAAVWPDDAGYIGGAGDYTSSLHRAEKCGRRNTIDLRAA